MVVSNDVSHDPRVAAEAASLTGAGHEVTVLGWDRRGTSPPEEVQDGVRIVRLSNSVGMRLRRYDILRLKPFQRAALRRALLLHAAGPFRVIHCHDLDTLPVGVRFKERTGATLVYDAHEVFPYLVELSRARRWAARFAAQERRLAPHADLVVAAGEGHVEYLAPFVRAPIVVVTNSKPLAYGRYEPPENPRMTVLYAGGLEPSRLLLPLAELAVEDGSFDVHVAGDGPLAAPIRDAAARSSGHLRYLGMLPMGDVLPQTRAADVVFAMFDPSLRLNRIGVPNKFFEALVAGRPIVVSRGTWVGSQVEAAGCGLAVEYSKGALHAALKSLQGNPEMRERMGRRALDLARTKYNWPLEERKLLDAYAALGVAR